LEWPLSGSASQPTQAGDAYGRTEALPPAGRRSWQQD